MTAVPGTNVGSKLVPTDSADTYPTHDANYGLGGLHTVANVTARDAIETARRYEGMLAYVISAQTTQQLIGGVTNSDWVTVLTGGSAVDGAGAAGLVAYWSDVNTITAEAAFAYDASVNTMTVGKLILSEIAAGTDNSVVVSSGGTLVTDEIDSRVWGTSLIDGAGTATYVPYYSDANTVTSEAAFAYDAANNRLDVGNLRIGDRGTYLSVAATMIKKHDAAGWICMQNDSDTVVFAVKQDGTVQFSQAPAAFDGDGNLYLGSSTVNATDYLVVSQRNQDSNRCIRMEYDIGNAAKTYLGVGSGGNLEVLTHGTDVNIDVDGETDGTIQLTPSATLAVVSLGNTTGAGKVTTYGQLALVSTNSDVFLDATGNIKWNANITLGSVSADGTLPVKDEAGNVFYLMCSTAAAS